MLESFGVPLPGETALIAFGILASQGHYSIVVVIAVAAAAAIVGDNLGYELIGRRGGRRLLERWGPLRRRAERILPPTEELMAKHGGKVVFFGRFTAVLRTYAAFLAGTLHMDWGRFLFFNATGGIIWSLVFGLGAYWLGGTFEKLSTPANIAFGVIGVSVAIWVIRFAHRNAERLEEQAERALPGPLE